jgi:hypothetical protein
MLLFSHHRVQFNSALKTDLAERLLRVGFSPWWQAQNGQTRTSSEDSLQTKRKNLVLKKR